MAKKIFDKEGLTRRINIAFDESGLNQSQFADECEVSNSTAGRWLSGETQNIPDKQREKIADTLEVKKTWLDSGRGMKRPVSQGPRVKESPEYYEAELEMMQSDPGLFKFLMDMENFKEKAIGILMDDTLSDKDKEMLFNKMRKVIRKKVDWLG